ncbi:unnamed protein product [Cyclocybe aegerita]|uniref:Uncharacterized protein n=1 Tax=Cyclocybe aegerita TaxID=1973307 RepID=A0A8S0VZ91_CYCAE|nr:unnamed protein product [Cyclocybe aegerita]
MCVANFCNIRWTGMRPAQPCLLEICRITFVYVPSALRWDVHGEAHKYVTELKVRVGHCKTDNSIDALRSRAAHSVLDLWSSTFQDPTYRGSEFLELQQPDGQPLQPSYLNGGPWLSTFGHSITEFAHVCWCITGHMPIGAYYRHFKINEPHGCTVWVVALASRSAYPAFSWGYCIVFEAQPYSVWLQPGPFGGRMIVAGGGSETCTRNYFFALAAHYYSGLQRR